MRLPFLLFCLCLTPVAAQNPPIPLAGHSHLGDAFSEGPRQSAYLMEGMGDVHFMVTTEDPTVQKFVDQGMTQLHGFWYYEAERSFRQAAALDPKCAIAYFGMALATFYDQPRAAEFARKAYDFRDPISDRERAYVDAIARMFAVDEKPPQPRDPNTPPWSAETARAEARKDAFKSRARRLAEDLEAIVFRHPEDIEAKALLVNQLWLNEYRSGISITSRAAHDALLDQIFAVAPNHPAHHYRIHLWDRDGLSDRALRSAALSGPAAPGIAHLWHMAGHTYARLDRHDDAAWQQEASARVDHAHMMRDRLLPDQIHNYAHNNEWLVRSLIDIGRAKDAWDLASNLVELPRHPRWNRPDLSGCSAFFGPRRLFQVLEAYELWAEVLRPSSQSWPTADAPAGDRARAWHWIATARYWTQDLGGAAEARASFLDAWTEVQADRGRRLEHREAVALGMNPSDPEVVASAADDFAELRGFERRLEGLEAFVAGRHDDGLRLLREGKIPPNLEVELLLRTGDTQSALDVARKAAKDVKGRAPLLALLVRALEAHGLLEEAATEFTKLRTLAGHADLDVAPFERLAPIAHRLGLPVDWRTPAPPRGDLGPRPPLASLGPFRFQPVPAPSGFRLDNGRGAEVSSSTWSGRPLLVVFFLGFDCLHCVEQLNALTPRAERFRDAGIDIVTIGTCTPGQISAAWAKGGFPFPILSDEPAAVFREWRAFDDFEGKPLHGTFLLDNEGLVRWQDVGKEPFLELDALLAESKRLLRVPVRARPGD